MANKNILGFKFSNSDSNTYYYRPYATYSTNAGTVAKTVSRSGFTRVTGVSISVKFTKDNTASSPTLNVNSTGPATIIYHGAALTDSAYYWKAGNVLEFLFYGTNWVLLNVGNTTYTISDSYSGDNCLNYI